jgi:hypothetical protein
MNTDEIYGGSWLSAASLKADRLSGKPLTISDAVTETFTKKDGTANVKVALKFAETEKMLPLNKTNWAIMKEWLGAESNNWKGKKIYLILTKRDYQGTLVDAIQIQAVEQQ